MKWLGRVFLLLFGSFPSVAFKVKGRRNYHHLRTLEGTPKLRRQQSGKDSLIFASCSTFCLASVREGFLKMAEKYLEFSVFFVVEIFYGQEIAQATLNLPLLVAADKRPAIFKINSRLLTRVYVCHKKLPLYGAVASSKFPFWFMQAKMLRV